MHKLLIALLLLSGCSFEEGEAIQRTAIQVSNTRIEGKQVIQAAPGKRFVTLELQQDPSRDIDWTGAIAVDWDGRWYRTLSTTVSSSSTGTRSFLGISNAKKTHVDVRLVFEIPEGAQLRSVTRPYSVVLSSTPPKSV
jgi:hypothetical protein